MGWPRVKKNTEHGFTIVELIVVIVIIGILAGISVFGYGAWRNSIVANQVKSDLNAVAAAMENLRTFNNTYPTSIPGSIVPSEGVVLTVQSSDGKNYCVDGSSSQIPSITFYVDTISKDKTAQPGTCSTRSVTSPPSIPTGLAIGSIGADQIGLTWVAVAGATSYTLQCASDAAYVNGFQQSTSTITTGVVTGLQNVTTHYCRINATNSIGSSAFTASVTTDTQNYPSPAGLAVTSTNNTQIALSWSSTSYATNYNVSCARDTGYTTGVQSVNTASTSATVSGLTLGKTYYCRVNAANASVTGPWSSSLTTATTANFGTIAAATSLNETRVGGATSDLAWTGISCSVGSASYNVIWVAPSGLTSSGWISSTTVANIGTAQALAHTWRVDTKCTSGDVDSSVTNSATKGFTTTVDPPSGSFGTIGWDGRFAFNANSNTYTCAGGASEEYQLVSTLINATSSTITYGWGTATARSVTSVNQGSRMTTYMQVRCFINSASSAVTSSGSRTDNASIDAPGSVPGWCAGSCGSPRGDRWSAVSCPAGTRAVYWAYAQGNYGNAIWGAYEAENFYGYDRGYYSYGDTMVNGYLRARCISDYTTSPNGPQSYAYY